MPDPPKLNYAATPPMHRRRSFRRWVYITVMLAIFAAGWWWMPPAWRRVEMLYWQHRCISLNIPPGTIVFDRGSKVATVDRGWFHFYSLLSPPGFQSEGTCFVGELRNSEGERRLVAVDIVRDDVNHDSIKCRVFIPGDLMHSPRQLLPEDSSYFGFPGQLQQASSARRDPNDPTRILLDCVVNDQKYLYSIWLEQDDFESVWSGQKGVTSPSVRIRD